MKKVVTMVFLLATWLHASAQVFETVKETAHKVAETASVVDGVLDERQHKGLNEEYVVVPDERWAAKLFTDFYWNAISLQGKFEDEPFKASLYTPLQVKEGIALSWRGLTLSFSIQPFGKYKNSLSAGINSYGRKFAFELNFKYDANFSGKAVSDDEEILIPKGSVNHTAFTNDVYYIFNGERFSYPAVFNQTRIQKRSAGSAIAALSMNIMTTKALHSSDFPYPTMQLRGFNLGIGAGYGYNWVLGEWTLHASLIPTLVLIDSSSLLIGSEKEKLRYQFGHFITTGNVAVVYNHNRFFAGFRTVVHNCTIGNKNEAAMADYFRVHARLSAGFRF